MHFVIGYAVKIPDSTSWVFCGRFRYGLLQIHFCLVHSCRDHLLRYMYIYF
jgi:hypothetical protein